MGIGDSKSKFEYGSILMQTDKPYFAPGEDVTGNIYLYLQQPFPGSQLELQLSGKEKVRWKRRKNNGGDSYTVTYTDDAKILDYSCPVYSFMGGSVQTGQYSFPFRIKLPYDIPASCLYTNYAASESFAQVKYKIKALLQPLNRDSMKPMKFKQTLVVRQLPAEVPMSSSAEYSDTVNSCCCCCSSGSVRMESQCDKTAYFPYETARIMAMIDNSNCSKDIKGIKVQLRQHVLLYRKKKPFEILGSDINFTHDEVLLEQEYPGLSKGERTNGMERYMEMNLGAYKPKANKSVFSDLFEEKDDYYLNEGVQPTVNGKLVQITYSLRVMPHYKTCCVCSPPCTEIGLFISPPPLPSYQPIVAPSDWNPQVFEMKDMAAPVPVKAKDDV